MEMEGRKWEDLNMDCLVNILGRVGMANLLLDVPYVCKSWYKATCNPQCWSNLDFTEGLFNKCDLFYDSDFSDDLFILFTDHVSDGFVKKYHLNSVESLNSFYKFVAKRANVCATLLKLPAICTREAIYFMSNECPNIRTLQLPRNTKDDLKSALPFLISKWKSLVNLTFPGGKNAQEIFKQLGIHCKNFEKLKIYNGLIEEDSASALATHLPNLKALSMRSAGITKENLLVILKSCTKLEFMDARDCEGFEENDDEILNATAHIHSAKLQGSTAGPALW